MAEGDSPTGQVIRGHLHLDAIPQQDTDIVLAHLASQVGQDLVPVIEPDSELSSGQSFDDQSLNLNLFLRHIQPPVPFAGLLKILIRTSFDPADRFLLLHAALLTLGNKPTLAAHRAQDAAFDDLFSESFQQHILRLVAT
jgi:hypothetical protein